MKKTWFTGLVFLLILITNCSEKSAPFKLPFDKNIVWHYDVRGFMSLERYPLRASESRGIPERDTIKVSISEIDTLGNDSILYRLSEGFVRFWGKDILLSKNGYQKFHDYDEPCYLIKYPLRLYAKWKNRFPLVVETYEVSALDTTITFNEHQYQNCIAIKVQQNLEGTKHDIEFFLNKEYGLVYYVDHDGEDEIGLLNMEKL